jgi:hypothetical protein
MLGFQQEPVGAILLAMAVGQSTSTQAGPLLSRASPNASHYATNLWEQSLLAITTDQSTLVLTDLPQSRASFNPKGVAPFDP